MTLRKSANLGVIAGCHIPRLAWAGADRSECSTRWDKIGERTGARVLNALVAGHDSGLPYADVQLPKTPATCDNP